MTSQFSAAPSSLGYLYQTLSALLLLLRSKEEAILSLEKLDDVVFEKGGNAKEQLQLKHHVGRAANLTNNCPDLWKTIRVWSTQLHDKHLSVDDTILTLVTTGSVSEGTIAASLKSNSAVRNNKLISEQLRAIAEVSKNKDLKDAFVAYLALSPKQQEDLISCIQILDGAPNIIDVPEEIKSLFIGVKRNYRDNVYERLEGWWFDLAIQHLYSQSGNMVSKRVVGDKIASINEQFKPETLPA